MNMNLLIPLLHIRYRQCLRIMREVGIFRFLILFFLVAGLCVEMTFRLKTESHVFLFMGVGWTTILLVHLNRRDKSFLKQFLVTHALIFFVEYALCNLVFIVILVGLGQILFGVIYVAGIFLISWVPYTFRIEPKAIPIPFVPSQNYDLISGLRRFYVLLLVILLGGFLLSKFIITTPVVIFMITSLFMEFNLYGEPREFIEISGLNSRQFLHQKVKIQLRLFIVLIAPFLLLFIILHSEYWWLVAIMMPYAVLLILYFIFSKYHFYRPNVRISEPMLLNTLFLYGGFLVPVMMPIVLLLAIIFTFRTYPKAISNLKYYTLIND